MNVKKIYFDMDGVLADFNRGVNELCGMDYLSQDNTSVEYDDLMWLRVKGVEHFYDKLELVSGAKELFEEVYSKYGDRCEILSAIPKLKRGILTAGEDKINWVRRFLSKDIVINIVLKHEKPLYCTGKDCILIDDLAGNIEAWEKIGGTGVWFTDANSTRLTLKKFGVL